MKLGCIEKVLVYYPFYGLFRINIFALSVAMYLSYLFLYP